MSLRRAFMRAALGALLLTTIAGGEADAQRSVRGADASLLARAERVSGDRFRFESVTPRGVRVLAVSQPRAETLRAIDRGLNELFAAARRRGYRGAALGHADYTVFVARPDRTRGGDGAYSPDLAVGAAQYRGSVYDRGGYVYAAGMVLAFDRPAFVIAEHERDWHRVGDVARYEGEHIVLYHHDRALYRQTMDHSRGGSHPIMP